MRKPDPILTAAIAAHQAGRLKEAEVGYQRVLRKRPNDPDALHFCGLLKFHEGHGIKAVELIGRSLDRAPNNPHAWNNLGNILIMQGKVDEAKEAYRRVTVLAPEMAEAWYNLGVCMRDAGQLENAAELFRIAIERQPGFMRAYESLGRLHYRLGRMQQAAEIYQAWVQRDPNNPLARHMAAATTGIDVPERANDEYVAKLFDKFAAVFDQNLKELGYRAPELVSLALTQSVGQVAARSLDILDAGCGTGLCGPLLKPLCRSLVGVDLSSRMIDHARERGGYNELAVGELCAFMRSRTAQFDAVISADTLVYFGALEEACRAARQALRGDGLFVFTVEALLSEGSEPYHLEAHGRYTHRAEYVRQALVDSGFEVLQIQREVLRMEKLQEVIGYLVVGRKP